MNRPSTAREALIVEAIGEVAALIDRVEAVTSAMDGARQALVQASEGLAAQAGAFDKNMTAIAENAKLKAVQHIARRTDEMARGALEAQRRAMEETARALFRSELDPALGRLALPLQHLAERLARPWERWLTHAATAAAASAVTWALAAWLWLR